VSPRGQSRKSDQTGAARRVAHLAQRPGLDLPDAPREARFLKVRSRGLTHTRKHWRPTSPRCTRKCFSDGRLSFRGSSESKRNTPRRCAGRKSRGSDRPFAIFAMEPSRGQTSAARRKATNDWVVATTTDESILFGALSS
jgi:hypothetical protein